MNLLELIIYMSIAVFIAGIFFTVFFQLGELQRSLDTRVDTIYEMLIA